MVAKMEAAYKTLKLPCLRMLGVAHTFTANSFSSFWGQRLSMVQAVHQAKSVLQLIGGSVPFYFGGEGVSSVA